MSEILMVKRPVVAGAPRRTPVAAMGSTLGLVGLGVFFWLSSARAANEQQEILPPLSTTTSSTTLAPAPVAAEPPQGSGAPASSFINPGSAGPVTLVSTTPVRPGEFGAPAAVAAPADRLQDRMRAPSLVVDFAQADMPRSADAPQSDSGVVEHAISAGPPGPVSNGGSNSSLTDTENFAARIGNAGVEVATARRMSGLDRMVPQGAVIGAVMETALNSDQPGFARAIVQRDVYSFDGAAVLIPAGSRVIGQYKSGVAQGASRLFVLWTRLIRPDGVSIELASPAVDDLGRSGVGGKVNRHFMQRYGGAILTSILSGGVNAAAAAVSGGSTIVVGTAGEASSLASQATESRDIPPTITTRQGAAVRIFVARDLDFSRVGPSR